MINLVERSTNALINFVYFLIIYLIQDRLEGYIEVDKVTKLKFKLCYLVKFSTKNLFFYESLNFDKILKFDKKK